jgi:hypothetical protein
MSLDDDIRQAIANNLTAEIGTRLNERLTQADADAERIGKLEKQNKEYEMKHSRWEIHQSVVTALDEREDEVFKREHEMEIQEAKMEIRQEWARTAHEDSMKVLEIVFKGPAQRLAFDLQGGLSGLMTANGMSLSPYANLNGKIETDGESG